MPNHPHLNGKELPDRVKYLLKGVEVTGDKTKNFGEPLLNMSLAGTIKKVLRDNQRRPMSPGEMEALENVVSMLARAYSGEGFTEKTYVHGATYFSIAGEIGHYYQVQEINEQEQNQKQAEEQQRLLDEQQSRERALSGAVGEALEKKNH
jgi:hypothetical protein